MTVIDTSAFSKFLLREENWEKIVPFLDPGAETNTLEMLFTESVNVIWKYVMRNLITREEGIEFFQDLQSLHDSDVLIVEKNMKYGNSALILGFTYDIPVYDSLFLAQAQHYGTSLVTSDKKQGKIAGELSIPVEMV